MCMCMTTNMCICVTAYERMCACMHQFEHDFVYTRIYVCVRLYMQYNYEQNNPCKYSQGIDAWSICIYNYIYVPIYTCSWIHLYACTYICMLCEHYVRMWTHSRICMRAHVHTYTHILALMRTYMHAAIYLCQRGCKQQQHP